MSGMVSVQKGIGIVYGLYHFSAELTQHFVNWLESIGHPYGKILCYAPGSCEFSAVWMDLAEDDPAEFAALQTNFNNVVNA
jgi:hypothetical protein